MPIKCKDVEFADHSKIWGSFLNFCTDLLPAYNKVMQETAPKGAAGTPYDLSTQGGSAARHTANSYLISAPGHYRIPLVYGNAIKNGTANPSSYRTSNSGTYILRNFKDHAGQDIASPYINVQNAMAPATQAGLVWADQSGMVEELAVSGSGTDSYVSFHVPAGKIRNGNAVIAVKNASGTVMWSWHLWFNHADALNTVACTNHQGYTYNFTKQTLGFAWSKWVSSPYDKPRVTRLRVEQTLANGGTKQYANIDITQTPGSVREVSSTLYQFGRKDALPGTNLIPDGAFTANGGNKMSIPNSIQNPATLYTYGTGWTAAPPTGYSYYNLWSMDNTVTGFNDNAVVKTIYDPCPAGFKMPASNAFTGFTTTGANSTTDTEFNVSGDFNLGWNFKAGGSSTATVYFPASGYRRNSNGSWELVGNNGFHWSAVPNNAYNGCHLRFTLQNVDPVGSNTRSGAFAVRPVSE